jgi:predicted GNAT family N-acyltransferase
MTEVSERTNGINSSGPIEIRLASGFDDLSKVMAIRAAVFLGEEDCPYEDEFDGNDMAATHLIAFCNGEPVGTLRIRWLADFVRFERMAIRRKYRSLKVLNALVVAALRYARRKGYRVATGLVREEVVRFWRRHGGWVCGDEVQAQDSKMLPMRMELGDAGHNANPPVSIGHIGSDELERLLAMPEAHWVSLGNLEPGHA